MNATGTKTFNQSSSPWCLDNDTRDSVIARRNVLAGLWAGRLLGLSNADLSSYATDVHRATSKWTAMVTSSGRSLAIFRFTACHVPSGRSGKNSAPITVKRFVR